MPTILATTGSGLSRAVYEANERWQCEPRLQGTRVVCLAADPRDERVVYAGLHGDGGGVLRSTDAGVNWEPSGLQGTTVKAMCVSPADGAVYAATKPPRLYRSTDQGASWEEVREFRRTRKLWFAQPAEWPPTPYVQGLAASRTDPGRIVAGYEACALVATEDGGDAWSEHKAGALRDCHDLRAHPCVAGYLYEGGFGGAAWSRDDGTTWESTSEGLDRRYGWAVAADVEDPERVYVSVSTGPRAAHGDKNARAAIFCRDGSDPWQKLGGGLPDPIHSMPYALLTHAEFPGQIWAALHNGELWHSRDRGLQWRREEADLGRVERMAIVIDA